MGPLAFQHAQETCLEVSLGITSFTVFGSVVFFGFVGSLIMEIGGAQYVFSFFFIISALFSYYVAIFVKDTVYKEHDELIISESVP